MYSKDDLKIIKEAGGEIDVFSKSPLRYATRAKIVRSLMQDDYIDLSIESAEPIDFNLDDKITTEGRDYFLNLTPVSKKTGNRMYSYNLRFESAQYRLRRYKVFNRDTQNRITDYEFDLVGDLEDFLNLIINNANNYTTNWELGDFPTETIDQRIFFNNQNCLTALNEICEKYGVEYYIEKSGNNYSINIGDIGEKKNYTFEYGKGNGLYTLERSAVDDAEVVTRLYGFGSSQNLPMGYRDFSPRLRMPTRDYVEDQGLINQFGFVEALHESDIRPEFVGKITSAQGVSEDYGYFRSTDMDFDLAAEDSEGNTLYLANDEIAIVSFLTGNLAGYEFDVHAYDHGNKEFTISRYRDPRGKAFPDAGAFSFQVGDKFTLLNILMPQSYVTAAEQRLEEEVTAKYQSMTKTNIKYVLDIDPLFMRDKSIELGDEIGVKDSRIGVDTEIRILRYEYDFLADKYVIDLSDVPETSLVKKIAWSIHNTNKVVQENRNRNQKIDEKVHVDFRDLNNEIFDEDRYFKPDNIREESISITKISKNARPQQMGVDGIIVYPNDGDENSIRLTAGSLTNFSIDDGSPKTWMMNSLSSSSLDPGESYYIYAKNEKEGNFGSWLLSTDEIQVDEDDDYYHFLTGVLYRPVNGKRHIDLIHGALDDEGSGKPIVDYHEGLAPYIVLPVNIPGIMSMTPEEQAERVQMYRNGIRMRISDDMGVNNFTFEEVSGEIRMVPKIPFTASDFIENVYML